MQSRQSVTAFCAEKSYHHLLVEFSCDEKEMEENIRDTAQFYQQNFDKQMNWTYICREKVKKFTATFESCTKNAELPLITVNSSENPAIHSVTARGVQGALQTAILGVLSSPVIKNQLYYFSRHGESDYNVLGRIGGDADLSPRGKCYAERLTKYFASTQGVVKPKMVNKKKNSFVFQYIDFSVVFFQQIWTSELCRTIQTAEKIHGVHASVKDLNEINAVCIYYDLKEWKYTLFLTRKLIVNLFYS